MNEELYYYFDRYSYDPLASGIEYTVDTKGNLIDVEIQYMRYPEMEVVEVIPLKQLGVYVGTVFDGNVDNLRMAIQMANGTTVIAEPGEVSDEVWCDEAVMWNIMCVSVRNGNKR